MKWGALFGWGIAIYAIITLSWNGLVIYQYSTGFAPRIFQLAVLIALSIIAGRSLKFSSWTDILPYSIFWAVMMGLLDFVYTVPFGGVQIYTDWNLWVGYALVVILPLFAPLTRFTKEDPVEIT
jgi:hypothetical protein